MKIHNVPGAMQAYNKNKVHKSLGIKAVEAKKDQMQVSNEAQLMSKVLQAAKNAPEIRHEKINEIKNALKQGTYNISAEDVAEKMLQGINLNKKI